MLPTVIHTSKFLPVNFSQAVGRGGSGSCGVFLCFDTTLLLSHVPFVWSYMVAITWLGI